jgi:hypothetical protein
MVPIPLDEYPVTGVGGVVFPFKGFVCDTSPPPATSDRRKEEPRSAIKKGNGQYLPLKVATDGAKPAGKKYIAKKETAKGSYFVNMAGMRVKYCRVEYWVKHKPKGFASMVVHHEKYTRISWKGCRMYVGDDSAVSCLSRSEHARHHGLGGAH